MKSKVLTIFCLAGAMAFGGVDTTNRETYEWAHYWWNHADDGVRPRVLIVGDSITEAASSRVFRQLEDVALVDMMTSSKNVKDPALRKEIGYMLGEYPYEVIHFNHGLHGLLIKEEEYEGYLRSYVAEVKRLAGNAKLVWGSITPLRGTLKREENQLLSRRNAVANKVMAEMGIPVNDLWKLIWNSDNADSIRSGDKNDDYHYNDIGNDMIGRAMAERIRSLLPPPKKD